MRVVCFVLERLQCAVGALLEDPITTRSGRDLFPFPWNFGDDERVSLYSVYTIPKCIIVAPRRPRIK